MAQSSMDEAASHITDTKVRWFHTWKEGNLCISRYVFAYFTASLNSEGLPRLRNSQSPFINKGKSTQPHPSRQKILK